MSLRFCWLLNTDCNKRNPCNWIHLEIYTHYLIDMTCCSLQPLSISLWCLSKELLHDLKKECARCLNKGSPLLLGHKIRMWVEVQRSLCVWSWWCFSSVLILLGYVGLVVAVVQSDAILLCSCFQAGCVNSVFRLNTVLSWRRRRLRLGCFRMIRA